MLRTPAAADYTGLAKSTLEKMRVRGDGCPFIRIGRAADRKWRFASLFLGGTQPHQFLGLARYAANTAQ